MVKRQRKKYIERAWNSYRQMVVPKGASAVQLKETRQAFYSGAAILFKTIMRVMDEDREPTAEDLRKMADLQAEIDAFGMQIGLEALGIRRH